jgi:hypothetical protein
MKHRKYWFAVVLWVCTAVLPTPLVLAQQDGASAPEPAATDPQTPAPAPEPAAAPPLDIEAASMPLQQYTDPDGRFGFAAPAQWGRLPSTSADEVVFQDDAGNNIRVSVAPLKVDGKAFSGAYVDTYLKVLAQTFSDVKFLGQRTVEISFRKATDYVFSAVYGSSPVTCHQVVLLGGDKVLYVTFAGFGSNRTHAEQLFQTALLSMWVGSGFGGATSASVSDPNAPAYVLAVPEGWIDTGVDDGNSHMFRPPSSRPTSAFVSTRVTKVRADSPFKSVDDGFVAAYAETVRAQHPPNAFEMRQTRKIFLGGEPAVRYDYVYVSDYGIRRAIMILCIRKDYLIGVSCDAADQSFPLYEQAFETLVAGFKFK